MNRWILDTLCCPRCRGSFILSETKGNDTELSEGTLVCTSCGASYPITDGIANLLPEDGR